MITFTLEYQDFNGNPVKEDYSFHLSKAEAIELQFESSNGLDVDLTEIMASDDKKRIFAAFKMLIGKTVGKKSEDGKRFIKSPEITKEFFESEAFSEFITRMMTDPDAATGFVVGVLPTDLGEQALEKIKAEGFSKKNEDVSKKNPLGLDNTSVSKPVVTVDQAAIEALDRGSALELIRGMSETELMMLMRNRQVQ